ncbi:MAG: hypothetical protein M1832_004143 [Thelocarpon impressellum]|nr:MAG: hypothetical protein M1832_004143 [Thelocarpon impressellum]
MEALKRDSLFADALREDFKHQLEDYFILSFYKTLPFKKLGLIVDKKSATLGLSGQRETQVARDADHSEVCKFASADGEYELVAGNLKRLAEGARKARLERDRMATLKSSSAEPVPQKPGPFCIKSQVALAYAYWLRKNHPESSVFWVHAGSDERFHEAFGRICQECKIPGSEDPTSDKLVLVRDWLKRGAACGKWLMVIDNADDVDMFFDPAQPTRQADTSVDQANTDPGLAQYVPECSHGAILVTTRNKQAGVKLAMGRGLIEIPMMDEEETKGLVLKRLATQNLNADGLSELVEQLERLPLALVQASAFMLEQTIGLEEYLELLRPEDSMVELLSTPFEDFGRHSEIPKAVTATWMVSFNQIRQSDTHAVEILSLVTFLDRQSIPKGLFEREERGALDLTRAFGTLKAFSLVTATQDGKMFDMHRLVQLVMRKWLTLRGETEKWAGDALAMIFDAYPSGVFENWKECATHMPHALAVLGHTPTMTTMSLLRASLSQNIAQYLLTKGEFEGAERWSLQASSIRKGDLGPEHPDTLTSEASLASAYWSQGRWSEAEETRLQVMDARKRLLGPEHADTLTSMKDVATTYWKQGRLTEAEELLLEVTQMRKRVLGPDHIDTLESMSYLGATYRDQGRWREAEETELQVVEMTKRNLGQEHPETLLAVANLAATYWSQGRFKEAEGLLLQVMDLTKRQLGPEHPDTLTSLADLAATYSAQERWAEAEEIELEVMEARTRLLGPEHPHTLTSMANLAATYKEMKWWTEAEKLLLPVVESTRRQMGPEHLDTLRIMASLAATFRSQGRRADAEELLRRGTETRRRVLGPEHADTVASMAELAAVLEETRRNNEAAEVIKELEDVKTVEDTMAVGDIKAIEATKTTKDTKTVEETGTVEDTQRAEATNADKQITTVEHRGKASPLSRTRLAAQLHLRGLRAKLLPGGRKR